MGAILKGLQSVLIALGIIALIGVGAVFYYNSIAEQEETTEQAAASADQNDNKGPETVTVKLPEDETESETETEEAESGESSGKTAAETFKLEAGHIHSYTMTVLKPATCTEAGEAKYECYCGDFYMASIPPIDHTPGDFITVRAATDTQTGLRQKSCLVCGRVLQEEVIPMLEAKDKKTKEEEAATNHRHSYTYEITTEPTCTEAGEKTYTCQTCGSTFKTKIPATNHPSRKTVKTDGDCLNPGKIETVCTICGAVISSEQLTYNDDSDHKWGPWEVTTAPTTESKGKKTRTCTVCGATQTKSIDKLKGSNASESESSESSTS